MDVEDSHRLSNSILNGKMQTLNENDDDDDDGDGAGDNDDNGDGDDDNG